MKAIAAMRNQFGGHAVRTEPPAGGDAGRTRPGLTTGRRVRRPPHRCTTSAPTPTADVALEPGRHRVHRPQRPGQDQPGRGDRLPVPARLAPGRHRRAAGPGRRRAGGGPGGRGARRADRGARGRAQPGPRQPGPGQPVAAAPRPRAGRPGAHGGLLARGPHPGQGRPVRPAPVPRRPAGAAHPAAGRRPRRLRPGARQRNSLLKTAGAARRGAASQESALSTLGVWDAHLAAHRRRAAGRAARAGRGAAPLRRQGLRDRRPRRDPRRRRDRLPAVVRAWRRDGRPRPRRRSTEALLAEVERRRNDELDRGISPGRPAPRRAAADPRPRSGDSGSR